MKNHLHQVMKILMNNWFWKSDPRKIPKNGTLAVVVAKTKPISFEINSGGCSQFQIPALSS